MAETLCSRCVHLRLDGPGNAAGLDFCSDIRDPKEFVPSETALDRSIETSYVLRDTFPGFPALREAARLGCPVCQLLAEAISQDQLDQDPDDPDWPPNPGLAQTPLSAVALYHITDPNFRYAVGLEQRGMLSSLEIQFTINVPNDRCYSPVLNLSISTENSNYESFS